MTQLRKQIIQNQRDRSLSTKQGQQRQQLTFTECVPCVRQHLISLNVPSCFITQARYDYPHFTDEKTKCLEVNKLVYGQTATSFVALKRNSGSVAPESV